MPSNYNLNLFAKASDITAMLFFKKSFFAEKSFLAEIILRFWIIVVAGVVCFSISIGWIYHSTSELQRLESQFEQLQQSHLNEELNARDFFANDLDNADFFKSNDSLFLKNVRQAHESFMGQLKMLEREGSAEIKKLTLEISLNEVRYFNLFVETAEAEKKLGFKDWGLEGDWRNSIHELEAFIKAPNNNNKYLVEYLQLRRNEKDFLLRHEAKYLKDIDENIKQLKFKFSTDKNFGIGKISLIEKYSEFMNSYVKGLEDISRKKEVLVNLEKSLNDDKVKIRNLLTLKSKSHDKQVVFTMAIFFLFIIALFYFGIRKQAENILRPVQIMKKHFVKVGQGDFTENLELRRQDEFLTLQNEFNLMLQNLRVSRDQMKMVAVGEAAAAISHDIANPLAVISGTARILEKMSSTTADTKNVQFVNHLRSISRNADRIEKIIRTVNKMSRQSVLEDFEIISIKRVVEESLFFIDFKVRKMNVEIHYKSPEEDVFISGDETLLSQALVNLISNSVDAIENLNEKWVQVDIQDNENDVEISVTDSGFGLSQQMKENLFKVSSTTKDLGKGTGLGLMIAKRIVDQHCGDIFVKESEHTCFVLRLPKEIKKANN
ncbi:MAG: ATP-binding protein [Pseudobdellovibrionaceae bacterium]